MFWCNMSCFLHFRKVVFFCFFMAVVSYGRGFTSFGSLCAFAFPTTCSLNRGESDGQESSEIGMNLYFILSYNLCYGPRVYLYMSI